MSTVSLFAFSKACANRPLPELRDMWDALPKMNGAQRRSLVLTALHDAARSGCVDVGDWLLAKLKLRHHNDILSSLQLAVNFALRHGHVPFAERMLGWVRQQRASPQLPVAEFLESAVMSGKLAALQFASRHGGSGGTSLDSRHLFTLRYRALRADDAETLESFLHAT
jgi:hypothetical protein